MAESKALPVVDKLAPSTASAKKDDRPFRPFISKLRNSFGYSSEESDSSLSGDSDNQSGLSSLDEKTPLPQCWGHRGVRVAMRYSWMVILC